jgi:zinc finger-like protein
MQTCRAGAVLALFLCRAEEAELWPLFSEHFSMQEQQHLVGIIIGRTGAEVLQVRGHGPCSQVAVCVDSELEAELRQAYQFSRLRAEPMHKDVAVIRHPTSRYLQCLQQFREGYCEERMDITNSLWMIIAQTVTTCVSQALLPWVTDSFSADEKEAMMDSLREATKNTMFDQWLDAVQGGSSSAAGGDASTAQPWTPTAGQLQAAAAAHGLQQQSQADTQLQLAEIAGYLAGEDSTAGHHSSSCLPSAAAAAAAAGPPLHAGAVLGLSAAAAHQQQHAQETVLLQQQTEVSGTVAESTNYVPGWEDIFNINQKQLEGAIRRVSNDPNLEPQRKAYLIQNIMVSRYIVTQQRRMRTEGSREGSGILPAAVGAAGSSGAAAVAGHAAAAGHSCCHHHHHHHGHAHHGTQQLGGHAAAAGHQPAAGAAVTHQQQLLQPGAGSSSDSGAAVVVAAAAAGGGVAAAVAAAGGVCHQTYTDSTSGILGCKHYRRAARLVAPCCGQVFTCRCAML